MGCVSKHLFATSKIVWFIAAPSNALVIAALLGVALTATRYARAGRRLAFTALLLLAVAGLSPLSNMLMAPLENRFPVWRINNGPAPAGIIILGGSVDADVTSSRNAGLELNEAGDRILAMLALARQFPEAKIILSAGAGALLGERGTEADEVRKRIAAYGLPPDRIIFENRSRTTYENALETQKLINPRAGERWLLVTSAWHMPRSIAVFRMAGLNVEAYPIDFRTPATGAGKETFAEISRGLRRFDTAMREWAGLISYRFAGASKDIWPQP